MDDPPPLDLPAYLSRIGYGGSTIPSLATLEELHVAHLAAIPFENLDVRLGRPVGLDLGSLQAKMVRRRRGGYCFEQNTLFAAVLRAMGFRVETLEARVRPAGALATLPRTHMLLRVGLPEGDWLADVGFGGDGPLLPVPLDGRMTEQPGDAYQTVREESGPFVLRRRAGSEWVDLYAFHLTPALPVDFEVAHHFTSTHPRSPFLNTLTAQRSTAEARHVLKGREYRRRRGHEVALREVEEKAAADLLRGVFGLDVDDDEVRRALPPV